MRHADERGAAWWRVARTPSAFARRVCVLAACGAIAFVDVADASHDPTRTTTIFVPGFDPDGPQLAGTFGDDASEEILDAVAALAGLPSSGQPGALQQPHLVTATRYYGDVPPTYYDAQDMADLAAITASWGGGVPRHALIVAKYARHVLERSGADQVNFVSASFGSLVIRWLIEHDVESLASTSKIARWLSVEGVLGGSWPATQNDLVQIFELVQTPTVDIQHMDYGWVEQHLHWPRSEASSPYYAGILIGQIGSTEDRLHERALTGAMITAGDFQPNDGVQGLWDARFSRLAPAARFLGRSPMLGVFHDTHYRLRENTAAWAQAAVFITQARRVTVTMTRATVTDVHEPGGFFLNLRPAEVVFQSRVFSPAIAERWGITGAISELNLEGAATPIYRYDENGQERTFTHVLFDDLVLASETQLVLELWAEEIDLDLRYGVVETAFAPFYQDLGGGWLTVPITEPGSLTFEAADWHAQIEVSFFDYPFVVPTDVGETLPSAPSFHRVLASPTPFRAHVRLVVPAFAGVRHTLETAAVLMTYDAAGRRVHRALGSLERGFVWDGRDERGVHVPAGVYFHHVITRAGSARGTSIVVR